MMLNNKGMTIIESVVAAGLLVVVTFGIASGISQLFKIENQTTSTVNEQQIVAMVVEGIRSDSAMFQKNMNNLNPDDVMTIDKLPLGFVGNSLIKRDECPPTGCSAYVGFMIQPKNGYPGIFQGTVRIIVPATDKSKEIPSNYTFLTIAN